MHNLSTEYKYLDKLESVAKEKYKKKLLILIYFSYIWIPVRNKIKNQLNTIITELSSIKTNNNNNDIEQQTIPYSYASSNSLDDNIEFYLGLPKLSCIGYLYYLFSTITHIIIVVNNSILIYRNKVLKVEIENNSYFSCHSPRFVLHEYILQDNMIWFSLCISALHLIWRYVVFVLGKKFDLKLIPFINSNDELYAKSSSITLYNYQILKMEQSMSKNKSGNLSELTTKLNRQDLLINRPTEISSSNSSSSSSSSSSSTTTTTTSSSSSSNGSRLETNVSTNGENLFEENYMIDFMYSFIFFDYYETKGKTKGIRYGMRPNRTKEARYEMIWIINAAFNIALILFFLATVTITPVAIRTIYIHQDEIYKGCEITYLDFIFFRRFISSTIVSATIYFDSAFAFLCPTNIAFILIYDLFVYWRTITKKINHLLRLIFKYNYISMQYNNNEQTLIDHKHQKKQTTFLQTILERDATKKTITYYHNNNDNDDDINVTNYSTPTTLASTVLRQDSSFKTRIFEGRNIVRDINELQSLVGDFFIQLRISDKFVSLLVTYAVSIWLVTNGIITLTGLQIKQTVGSAIIKVFQFLGLIIISIMSIFILTLKRKTEPAYKSMSSLMALDPTKSKRRWIGLLKYYTEKPHYGITLWRNQTFTLLTYFKLLSYTFTLIALVENMKWYGRTIFLDSTNNNLYIEGKLT